jgi:hypothetical protein
MAKLAAKYRVYAFFVNESVSKHCELSLVVNQGYHE